MSGGVVVYRRTGGPDAIDAIDEHSRRLVDALATQGIEAAYAADGLTSVTSAPTRPSWILLQYNPFRFGRSGFAPGLIRDALALRRRGIPLAIMVHEAWVDMTDWRTTLIGLWQRLQLRTLVRLADAVMTSTEALAREMGRGAVHVPSASNITPASSCPEAARDQLGLRDKLVVALLGGGNPSRALDYAEEAIKALANTRPAGQVVVLSLGADAPPVRVPSNVELRAPGPLREPDLSLCLWASDLVLLPFTDGLSTRRTSLMAALAHGIPVLGLNGHNTDAVLAAAPEALTMTPLGDPEAFARHAVKIVSNRRELRIMGERGRALYESRFDWPVVSQRIASELRAIAPRPRATSARDRARRSDEIVFVAHEVRPSGGMEAQSEQLVRRLLEAGRRVTVIARICSLDAGAHDGLTFIRVPTPRRPASVGYTAFFVVATMLARRHRGGLLHTTGAIVANRVDLATVHYCHRAARTQMQGSRASRPGRLYRLNAAVAGFLSQAGERWCYRPARTRLLCAVSEGVADELREQFPAMRHAVRAVPNGVDSAVFRPDPAARREIRAQLGLDEHQPLALFVGGDWERKGLRHAVDALSLAPDWHLGVAGEGDPQPLLASARAAGTQSRLHLLGKVADMPPIYAAGDAFVMPTTYEAFPLVVLEAAASGLPLLVAPVNGAKELVNGEQCGWFIPRDGKEIGRRLQELSAKRDLARQFAKQARVAAQAYSWEAMSDAYLALYAELAHGA